MTRSVVDVAGVNGVRGSALLGASSIGVAPGDPGQSDRLMHRSVGLLPTPQNRGPYSKIGARLMVVSG